MAQTNCKLLQSLVRLLGMACRCAYAHACGHKHGLTKGRELGLNLTPMGSSANRCEMEAGGSCKDSTCVAGLLSLATFDCCNTFRSHPLQVVPWPHILQMWILIQRTESKHTKQVCSNSEPPWNTATWTWTRTRMKQTQNWILEILTWLARVRKIQVSKTIL